MTTNRSIERRIIRQLLRPQDSTTAPCPGQLICALSAGALLFILLVLLPELFWACLGVALLFSLGMR